MESPVRICIGAALVVNLLLLCNALAEAVALPNEITSTTAKDERVHRYKANNTRTRLQGPDVALNELAPKEATSEEHTEKNAKYKDRGRVRFEARAKSTTSRPKRSKATSTTETATLVIVTPTAEVKNTAQIIDSMRKYKKSKMPILSSTTPMTLKESDESEEKDEDSFEKYSSDHDNFFTIPSFDYEFKHDSEKDSSSYNKKENISSFTYPSYSKEDNYGSKEDEPFKSSFFDFNSELTTPKNDFFDKKYNKISSSIIKKLDSIKSKSPPPNVTNVHKIVKENIGLEKLNRNRPSNKSSVFIHNTKEIRVSDNEGANSDNKELSDVHGTSIYYEMSVLSTETYAINHSDDDDCEGDSPSETTSATPEVESSSLRTTEPTMPITRSTSPSPVEKKSDFFSTQSSNYVQVSSTINPILYSTPSLIISSTEKVTRLFPNYRNRSYSKHLNLTGTKDSLNSVTSRADGTYTGRTQTRKFHYTTPRTKPVWMSPRRNVTRVVYAKPSSSPKTIYSEYFNIKDKLLTAKPMNVNRTVLTTVSSSEIDPILQSDVIGTSKVVHTQSVTDNTIPSLRKRGSMRFKTSTASSAEVESDIGDLEMPSTAWALASLISPPSLSSTVANVTENELQKVGEVIDIKETGSETTGSTTTTTVSSISNDIITKKVTEVNQNKLPWQPMFTPTSPSEEIKIIDEIKTESLPAESNVYLQSSAKPTTSEDAKENKLDAEIKSKEVKPLWIPATVETATTTDKNEISNETIPPVDALKSTGFEPITKLPASVTTPQDEIAASSETNQTFTAENIKTTTDFEITTIRFSYVPTETTEDITDSNRIETTTNEWNSVMPTRTKATTIIDGPITTYRPVYMTTTEMEETTTVVTETTPVLEVSSQITENATEIKFESTETVLATQNATMQPTVEVTSESTHISPTSNEPTTLSSITSTTSKITTTQTSVSTTEVPEDTTSIVIEVVTEINTEKSTIITLPPAEVTSTTTEDSTSEENSHSNEINYEIKTESSAIFETSSTVEESIAEQTTEETTEQREKSSQSANIDRDETTTVYTTTKAVNELEDLTSYAGEMTTEAAPRGPEEAGSGAAIAITVSTIGVIALVLIIGLLLVLRRRGRRGVYAQRCTPVSLDAYSLDSVSVGHRKGNHRLRASKRSYGNPAYDDEVTSHPMQYPALASFALDVDSMTAEFAEIPTVSVRPEEVPPGCEDKNRYSNVLPLPETRVPLQRIGNDPTSEYINANYVTGPGNIKNYYILCQAPLSNTVADFWRMIWEQNSRLVVMLTEYMENGVEKCYEYLPPSEISDNKRTFGDFKIILKKREQRDKYAISSVQLINMATRTWREVTHLWYFWPAKGVPEDYDSVIDFLFEMRSYMKVAQTAKEYDDEGVEVIYGDQNRSSFNNLTKLREENGSSNGVNVYSPARAEEQMRRANNGTLSRMKAASEVEGIRPCVVVCASGAGRSAALVALDVCARALSSGSVDVPRAVRRLRTLRAHALSNRHHYMFLYKVLSEYGNKIMGGGDTI